MKKYLTEDGKLLNETNPDIIKGYKDYKNWIDVLIDPYSNIQLFELIVKKLNPSYNDDLAKEVLQRNKYIKLISDNPYIVLNAREIYVIDTKEDCEYLLSLDSIPEDYFYLKDKDKLEMLRDYIISSNKFEKYMDNILDDDYSTIRLMTLFKCPEIVVGIYIKAIRGVFDYVIKGK